MTTVAPTLEPSPRDGAKKSTGAWSDRVFSAVALGAGLLVLVILALIAYVIVGKAWPAFKHQGPSFFTSQKWDPNNDHFGALQYIYGTVIAAVIALVFAVPLSFGIALFITELASKRLRTLVTYIVDLLAAIPSVVYGFWAFLILSGPLNRGVYQHVADTIGKVPGISRLLGGKTSGVSFMTAGLILAIMIIPIITSLSREALLTVPQDDKNAALAMGATRWEMLRISVFPRISSGLVGAVMLGLGRALGETIAVALVIGANAQLTSHLLQPGDSMASAIAHNFPEATGLNRSALIGMGAALFGITIIVNVIARLIVRRSVASLGEVVR
jgi:phosphate transport system permease protein